MAFPPFIESVSQPNFLDRMSGGMHSLVGLLVGSASLYWIGILAEKALKKEALGEGGGKTFGMYRGFLWLEGCDLRHFWRSYIGGSGSAAAYGFGEIEIQGQRRCRKHNLGTGSAFWSLPRLGWLALYCYSPTMGGRLV